jgi:regulator of sigma E protease
MDIAIKIAAFIVTIGILVTFHELGHYLAARLMGIKVLKFSVGFGRALITRTYGADKTEWVLAAIPLGGYVRMLDGRVDRVAPADAGRAFEQKPVWRRSIVILAGPFANFLLAVLIYLALFVSGVPGLAPVIAAPGKGTAAAQAGIGDGERILTFNGAKVESFAELRWQTLEAAVKKSVVTLETQDVAGKLYIRKLDLSVVDTQELERDLNQKVGLSPYFPPVEPKIGRVLDNSPAAAAGLQAGDVVLAIDGERIKSWQHMVQIVAANPEKKLALAIKRNGSELSLSAKPVARDQDGKPVGRLGMGIDRAVEAAAAKPYQITVRYGPVRALGEAARKTWDSAVFSLKMMGKMITGEVSWRNLSGPITIADYAGRTAVAGGIPFLEFLALISVSLGVINLLPIPVLDGGHLMYHLAEAIKGKPISDRALEIGQRFGLFAVLMLAGFAIFNDIGRILGAG